MKIFKRVFALVLACILFAAPVTALAAVNPDWIYVDPDGGFKSFGFESSPYFIEKGYSGAIENNENNTYWRVKEGGQISFSVNYVKPVLCRYTVVKIGSPGTVVHTEEIYSSGHTCGGGNLPAGNYAMYVVPLSDYALIDFYAVDTR